MVVKELANAKIENWPIAKIVGELECSVIREILKFSSQPGVISFAGGLPAPELFPLDAIRESLDNAIKEFGPACVQYSLSRGVPPLCEMIAKQATEAGEPSTIENILITSGSQEGLDLLGRVFIEPGSYVMTENPTYVGALQAFDYYQPKYATVEMDDQGMIIDEVEAKIEEHHPKFIYTVSNFQNPTGITMSMARREALVEVASKHGVPIVDDNPYVDVRFAGEPLPSLKSLAPDIVIALHTYSKVCAPGMRIGWINGPKEIMADFEKVRQGVDLHTNTMCQYMLYELTKSGKLAKHVEVIKKDYRAKRDLMIQTMRQHFPPGIKWTEPEGGMFLWVTLPEHMSAKELMPKAIDLKVAYVYGQPFFPNEDKGANTLRLNFSNATHENIVEGIKRLAQLFADHM